MLILLSFSPVMVAVSLTTVTPYDDNLKLTPAVNFFTTLSFLSIIFDTSKEGALSNVIPYLLAFFMLSSVLAEYKSVFVGIHPSLRHTPPMCFFSKRTVFNPFDAAISAALYPAGPPPIIAISNSIVYLLIVSCQKKFVL